MKLLWTDLAWEDYLHWQDADQGDLAGWWSRRITGEHRLVYRVIGKAGTQRIEIASCRYHY